MIIAVAQTRISEGRFAANTERLCAAVRLAQDRELDVDLCVAPLNALSGWPACSTWSMAAGKVAREEALRCLAKALSAIPDAPPLLLGEICDEGGGPGEPVEAETWLIHGGQALPVELSGGWGLLAVAGETLVVCLGNALHAPEQPVDLTGVQTVLHLDAETYTPARRASLVERYAEAALRLGKALIRVNAAGGSGSHVFGGESLSVDADGRLVYALPFLQERVGAVHTVRTMPDAGKFLPLPAAITPDRAMDTCAALICGLRDFVGDAGGNKVVLGLSGGMDSALVAALAAEAFGADKVLGVLMPSPWTSEESERDARELAAALGIETLSLPITSLMQDFATVLAPRFAEREPDVTEENVQSRIRGVLLMALANKEGRFLLATGNKSELGVGYCTLYGDTAGALAPLGDVYKTEVYELAAAINRRAGREVIPMSVFMKAPTAELRPGQKDQDSLPPYEVLDAVLRELVEGEHAPSNVCLPGIEPSVVQRVVHLLYASEFKRRQTPPALHVSERPFALARFPL